MTHDVLDNGAFENGKRSGNGTYTWKNGDKYQGEWADDAMSGNGTYTFANGSTLTGQFGDNSFKSGTYSVSNDFGNYSFTISGGKPQSVKITMKDGTTYDGGMDEKGLNGRAQIKYSNGDKYDGGIASGVKSGSGKYTWASGASYEGAWQNDVMHGNGTYVYGKNETGYQLTGTFNNGRPNGECYYYQTMTKKYKTTWENGTCVKVYE